MVISFPGSRKSRNISASYPTGTWYEQHAGFVNVLPTGETLRVRHLVLGEKQAPNITTDVLPSNSLTSPEKSEEQTLKLTEIGNKLFRIADIPSANTAPRGVVNVLQLDPAGGKPQQTLVIVPFYEQSDERVRQATQKEITRIFKESTGIERLGKLTLPTGRVVPKPTEEILPFFETLVAGSSFTTPEIEQSQNKIQDVADILLDMITARDPDTIDQDTHTYRILIPKITYDAWGQQLKSIIEQQIENNRQRIGKNIQVSVEPIESLDIHGVLSPEGEKVATRIMWPVIPTRETWNKRLQLQNDKMNQILGEMLFTRTPTEILAEAGSGKTELIVRLIMLSQVISKMPQAFYYVGQALSRYIQQTAARDKLRELFEETLQIGFPYSANETERKNKSQQIINLWRNILISQPNSPWSSLLQQPLPDHYSLRLSTVLYTIALAYNNLEKNVDDTIWFVYPSHQQQSQEKETIYDLYFHPYIAEILKGPDDKTINQFVIGQSIFDEFAKQNRQQIQVGGSILMFNNLLEPIIVRERRKIKKEDGSEELRELYYSLYSIASPFTSFAYLKSNAMTLNERLAPMLEAYNFALFEGLPGAVIRPGFLTVGSLMYRIGSRASYFLSAFPKTIKSINNRIGYTIKQKYHQERSKAVGVSMANPFAPIEYKRSQIVAIVLPKPKLGEDEIDRRIEFAVSTLQQITGSGSGIGHIYIIQDFNKNERTLTRLLNTLKEQGYSNVTLTTAQDVSKIEPGEQGESQEKPIFHTISLDKTISSDFAPQYGFYIKTTTYGLPQSQTAQQNPSDQLIEQLINQYGLFNPNKLVHPFNFRVDPTVSRIPSIPQEILDDLSKELLESINRILGAVSDATGDFMQTDLSEAEGIVGLGKRDFLRGMTLFTELTHIAYWLMILPTEEIIKLSANGEPLYWLGITHTDGVSYGEPLDAERIQFVHVVLSTLLKSLELIRYARVYEYATQDFPANVNSNCRKKPYHNMP
jgi:hypothetical protein